MGGKESNQTNEINSIYVSEQSPILNQENLPVSTQKMKFLSILCIYQGKIASLRKKWQVTFMSEGCKHNECDILTGVYQGKYVNFKTLATWQLCHRHVNIMSMISQQELLRHNQLTMDAVQSGLGKKDLGHQVILLTKEIEDIKEKHR